MFYPHQLPKNDARYINWKNSLKKRPPPWNKGQTKESHLSVKKISVTLKQRGINNFKEWRKNMISIGQIKKLAELPKNVDLAILTGLILGDGHIEVYPRTERLTISLNTKYPNLILYTTQLMEKIFSKKTYPAKITNVNCVRVSLYQKSISKRIQVISGNSSKDVIGVPEWIFKKNEFIIGCLKGLFEAEGSLSVHNATCTYNFQFKNKSQVLLKQVENSLKSLGFHPEVRTDSVRLRKRMEVQRFSELIQFRKYCPVV